jgi:hypothetical protein
MSSPFAHKINVENAPDNWIWKVRWNLFNRYGIWNLTDILPYKWRDFYWSKIRTIFKPAHKRIRKAVPRDWRDLDYIIESVNFEILKSFYEDEYKKDIVDWTSTPDHKEFAKWLEAAYKYVTDERPVLQKRMDEAYPEEVGFDLNRKVTKTSYKKLYGEVERYENLITKKDTELMIEIIKRRRWFWT